MNIETLNIGMKVRHPQYGVGVVKSLTEQTAEIVFDDTQRTIAPVSSDLQPAEPTATLSELEMPLSTLIRDTAHAVVEVLGLEQKDVLVEGLATRWQRGTLVMQPADSSLQSKEVPLETFFHKIVMIRNNLRVLEQKVNASDKLSDADKFDLQQYITRCYGSLTTFNILFKNQGRPVPKRSLAQRWLRLLGQSAIGNRQSAVAASMTTAGTLLQRASYAQTGILIAMQPAVCK